MKEYHSRDLRNFIQTLKDREADEDFEEDDEEEEEEFGHDSVAASGANSDIINDPVFDEELERFRVKLEQTVH
jgi:hypothetical protein